MAGNSQRKGAIKKSGKGNPTAGSGGRVRRGLEGRGPTPKAKDRPYHQAHKAAKRAEREKSTRPKRRTTSDAEWAAGRNSVVELLQAGVPVAAIYVAEGAERDGRMREAFKLAAEQGLTLLEVTRNEMDRMTGGAVHQGLAARLPAYEYAHADDLLERAADAKEPALVVALDSVTDPRNLGAVVRSAAGFGAHGVVIRLVVKTTPSEQYRVSRLLRERLKAAFDEEAIEIPFPQQTIWHRSDPRATVG